MARSAERSPAPAPSPETGPRQPALYSFDDALGGDEYRKQYIESEPRIFAAGSGRTTGSGSGSRGSAGSLSLEQRKAKVERDYDERLEPFASVAKNAFIAAHRVNAFIPELRSTPALTTIADIDRYMPGAEELLVMTKDVLEPITAPKPNPSNEQQSFLNAMHMKAEAWNIRAAEAHPPIMVNGELVRIVTPEDYDIYPVPAARHGTTPPSVYEIEQDKAIDALVKEAMDQRDAAANPIQRTWFETKINGLEGYRKVLNGTSSLPTGGEMAAKRYASELNKGRRVRVLEKAMKGQMERDRLFVSYDLEIKAKMREALDEHERSEVERLGNELDPLRKRAASRYDEAEKGMGLHLGGRNSPQVERSSYDNKVEELLAMEERLLTRQGRDEGTKPDVDGLIGRRMAELSTGLGKDMAAGNKGAWEWGNWKGIRKALFYAANGRDLEGTEVKKGWQKNFRLALKLGRYGLIGASALVGGVPLAIMLGTALSATSSFAKGQAKAGAERVADINKRGAKEEAIIAAIQAATSTSDKIRAALKLDAEARIEYATSHRRRKLGRVALLGGKIGVGLGLGLGLEFLHINPGHYIGDGLQRLNDILGVGHNLPNPGGYVYTPGYDHLVA
jgi:hypothetical protein